MTPRGTNETDPAPEDQDDSDDSEFVDEDYEGEYEEDEYEEEDEEEKEIERVSFDRSNLPAVSAKATKEQLRKQDQRKREQQAQSKRHKLIFHRIVPGVIAVVLVGILGVAAWKMIQRGRLTAEAGTPGGAGNSTLAGGTATAAEMAQKQVARDLILGREAVALGASGEPTAPDAAGDPGELVSKYLEAARRLTNEGKFADARKLLEKAVLLAPETTDLYLLYGTSFLNEEPGKARANAVKALQLEPHSPGGLKLLGLAYQAQRNVGVASSDEVALLEMEVRDYEHVLGKSPDWPELIYACASQRLRLFRLEPDRKEDLEITIGQLERVIPLWNEEENGTEIASAHHQLGRALKYKADALADAGEQAEAEALYERSIAEQSRSLEFDTNRFDSLGQIVLVHRARNEKEKALAAVEGHLPRIENEAVRARVYEMLGGLHLESEQESESIAAFNEALKLSAKLPNSYLALARLHWENDDTAQTEQMLTRGVAAIPNFLDAHCQLGLFYVEIGSPQQAIAVLERAIRIPPPQAVLVDVTPSRNAARNRYYYQAAGTLAALYLEHEENTSQARYAAAVAQKFGTADAQLRDTMGWIHFLDGEYEKAAGHLEPLAAAANAPPVTHYHLAALYAKQGKKTEALGALESALAGSEDFPGRADAEALRDTLREE